MALCERCKNFDIQAFAAGSYPYRGYLLSSVFEACKQGCSFCSLLLEHLSTAHEEYLVTPFEYTKTLRSTGSNGAQELPFNALGRTILRMLHALWPQWVHFKAIRNPCSDRVCAQPDAMHISGLSIHISSRLPRSIESSIPGSILYLAAEIGSLAHVSHDISGHLSVAESTLADCNLEAIHKWHKDCRTNHPDCNKTLSKCQSIDIEQAPLPTRCVEVASENGVLSLCLKETGGQHGRYVTLSHRWGPKTASANTTMANYACRTGHCNDAECPPMELTTLFSDAAQLTSRLGIKYIWIDSICIIQDDVDDWGRESTKMADYYQFSWLTIAATAVTESGGIISTVKVEDMPRVARLPYRDKIGQQTGHLYTQFANLTARQRDYEKFISQSDMLARGWVYQEWLLSRRIVSFSRSAMFVQCQRANPKALSGGAGESIETPQVEDIGFLKMIASINRDGFRLHGRVADIAAKWRVVVESYSKLSITQFTAERLIALAGIAVEYEQAFQSTEPLHDGEVLAEGEANDVYYICGLWFTQVLDLLWEHSRPSTLARVSGIPTWSWASICDSTIGAVGVHTKQGMPVRWTSRDATREVLCTMESATRIPVQQVSHDEWRPHFEQATHMLPKKFGNENRFVVLRMRGRLQHVLINELFDTHADTATVAYQTGHDGGQQTLWRKVSFPSAPDVIWGWASLEHPDLQTDAACRSSEPLYAFFISKFPGTRGSLGLGRLISVSMAYEVLFLKAVSVPGFENSFVRVGVGRLFGDEVNRLFPKLTEQDIRLL